MPSLKDLKNRIGSVKNTQKITKAMKMVAAAKLRKAQEKAEGTRPYSRKLQQVIANLSNSIEENNRPILMSGRLDRKDEQIKSKSLLIVTSSDRGLCGGFNTNLIKAAKKRVDELQSQNKEVKIVTVGKKAKDVLKSAYSHLIIKSYDAVKDKEVDFLEADEIGKLVLDLFNNEEIDTAEILFAKFVNPMVQITTNKSLIPLDTSELEANDNNQDNKSSSSISAKKEDNIEATYEYEPSEEEILEALLPKNISVQIFRAMLENSASEQGARMTAMDNATKNASDMIGKLTLQYNRSRQAAITTELTEIVAGAEAI